ncbi:MAG: hypothetical protein LBV72_12945 [Tannerella sp.]|jgi:enamine deaminase RidA (YjgF/YER057c/UK114 family)|nr:hypothetical protein [Tannerella sp.]
MKYKKIVYPDISAEILLSIFELQAGISEYHAMIRLTDTIANVSRQYKEIEEAIRLLEEELRVKLIWKRYFVSDAVNQVSYLTETEQNAAVSVVQQPPLNGTKVAVWAYLLPDVQFAKDISGITVLQHNGYQHLYHTQLYSPGENESEQTTDIFHQYIEQLSAYSCTLADNCIRTWVYVQGVDTHYKGMVTARRTYFEEEGLTPQTHFIASTGIEGKYIHPETLVFMDAYAIKGLQPGQIRYLHAPTHLNPTHEYGVTFERGTVVEYGDRRHVFISGTASINNQGEIEHPMDIIKQTGRMFENIRALLDEAECSMEDVAHLIVYLRDSGDYHAVNAYLERVYPDIPFVILWAPVCRPGWLIEVECMAVKAVKDDQYQPF